MVCWDGGEHFSQRMNLRIICSIVPQSIEISELKDVESIVWVNIRKTKKKKEFNNNVFSWSKRKKRKKKARGFKLFTAQKNKDLRIGLSLPF